QIDNLGNPITGNAARSRHQGLELEGRLGLARGFELSGNATLSDNHFVGTITSAEGGYQQLDGNAIALFPNRLANVTLGWRHAGHSAGVRVRHIGEMYLDNTQDDRGVAYPPESPPARDKHIGAHTLLDADATLDLGRISDIGRLSLTAHGGNLTDVRYET